MRGFAAALPTAFVEGFRAGRELAMPNGGSPLRVYVVGMGASAIAADLVRGVVEAETSISLTVVRGASLPRAADARSRAILVSYSGETWETLSSYEGAGRVGAARTVVTSGGTLAERAESEGVDVVRIPPGLPPRSAVGHLVGAILGLLDPAFPESNEGRVQRIAEAIRPLAGLHARARGPAALVADGIRDRLPYVYAESAFLGLARRWKTQIEENAKRVAVFDEVPELFHNAIVGWDAISRAEAARYAVVLLEWSEEEPIVRRSFRYLERLLRGRGVRVVRAPLAHDDRLEAVLAGVSLGDSVSLFLAERRRADPYPVDAIGRLKESLRTARPSRVLS
jgi:glucose/mannose-6-phosphate isomerase